MGRLVHLRRVLSGGYSLLIFFIFEIQAICFL